MLTCISRKEMIEKYGVEDLETRLQFYNFVNSMLGLCITTLQMKAYQSKTTKDIGSTFKRDLIKRAETYGIEWDSDEWDLAIMYHKMGI